MESSHHHQIPPAGIHKTQNALPDSATNLAPNPQSQCQCYTSAVADVAGIGARKLIHDDVDLSAPPSLRITGCKLTWLTQKLAYHAIRQRKVAVLQPRPRTAGNIRKILDGLKSELDIALTEAQVWTSLKGKHLTRECRQFVWMTIHDGYMVGDKWLRDKMSDELRARAPCQMCGVIETMEHILFHCSAVG